jgi:N-methylhydantoinase A
VSFNGQMIDAVLYERDDFDIGATISGPALVEQFDATTVIPPGWNGQVDGYGNLIMART